MFVLLVTGAVKRVGLRGFYFGLEKCYFSLPDATVLWSRFSLGLNSENKGES